MKTEAITNSEDLINTTDIIDRIAELQEKEQIIAEARHAFAQVAESPEELDAAQSELDAANQDFDEEAREELKSLRGMAEQGDGYGDWASGEVCIRDSYFTQYAQEICQDIGDLPHDLPGYLVIDWDATAYNLKVDYTCLDFDGVKYWMRT